MAIRIRYSGNDVILEGDRQVLAKLDVIRKRMRDLRWLWSTVTELFVEKEKLWFAGKGQGRWAPLSPTYATWKAIHYPGRPLMVRSGDLRSQLTSSRKAVLAETDRQLFVGTAIPYAVFHQEGTSKMPARPPLIPAVSLQAGIARRVHAEVERVF